MTIEPQTPHGEAVVSGVSRVSTLLFAVGAVSMLVAAVGLAFHDIDSTDIWTHLAVGEDILKHGRIPRLDPFDHSNAPGEWINSQWLTDVVLALLMRAGGATALVLWGCVLVSLSVALPFAVSTRRVGPHAALLGGAVLTLLIVNERFLVRPELVSLLAVVILHAFLHRARRLHRHHVVVLFIGQALWTNAHPAFLLGPLLVTLHLVSNILAKRRHGSVPATTVRMSALALVAVLAATTINPWGVRLPLHAVAAVADMSQASLRQGIVEWQPTFSGAVASDLTLLAFIVALLWSVGAAWAARRQATAYEFLVFVLLTALALQARRHLAVYAVVVPPWLALQTALSQQAASHRTASRLAAHARRLLRTGGVLILAAILVGLAMDVWRGRFYRRFGPPRQRGASFARQDHPTAAIETFIRLGRPQPVFNNIAAGSQLLWLDAGRTTPYVDGRLISAETFHEYRMQLGSPRRFADAATARGWQSVLLALQPYAPKALFNYLYEQPRWHLMAFDASGALFVRDEYLARRRTQAVVDSIARIDLDQALPTPSMPPAGRDGFWQPCDPGSIAERGEVLLQLGFAEAARSDLSQAWQRCTSNWQLGLLLSTALLDVGRVADAHPLVERALREDAGRAEAWTNLGRIHAASGNWQEARACWQHALDVIPPDPTAAQYLQKAPPPSSP